jgi:acetyl esterase/lipase
VGRLTAAITVLATLCAAMGLAGAPAAAKPDAPRPVVLLLHAGGFILEDPDRMAIASAIAQRLGFDPVVVAYPEFNLPGAIAAAESAARLQRPADRLYAYGDSAGGTLAALLAEADLVDAAATYSPVANMKRFAQHQGQPEYYEGLIDADRRALLRASPGLFDSDRPILAMAAAGDDPYLRDAIGKWARRDDDVRRWLVPGPHIGGITGIYPVNATRAMRWLAHGP